MIGIKIVSFRLGRRGGQFVYDGIDENAMVTGIIDQNPSETFDSTRFYNFGGSPLINVFKPNSSSLIIM